MSDSQKVIAIGALISIVGIVTLLTGITMPATSTHTSEACIDDPTSFGQDCYTSSVKTTNPIRGPTIGIGILSIIGGVGIIAMRNSSTQASQQKGEYDGEVEGSFTNKLRERQKEPNRRSTSEPDSE
ncbi:hypothetical protein GCM10009067_38800 [Haloarcula sebkhae]|uniref:Transmembrane protein n=1 Tax=Haloarcula sebkhae TaxID=932660 RepID=A0A830EQ47_9EURY|nr:hypothetical protein GCM10009067_38800 [Haloarcula sebkhae]